MFSFSRGHLCYLTFMKGNAPDDLRFVVNHIPSDHVACRHPLLMPNGLCLQQFLRCHISQPSTDQNPWPSPRCSHFLWTVLPCTDNRERFWQNFDQYFSSSLLRSNSILSIWLKMASFWWTSNSGWSSICLCNAAVDRLWFEFRVDIVLDFEGLLS